MPRPETHKVVVVDEIPGCDFCNEPGPYDFRTHGGSWAHGCKYHWKIYSAFPALGMGRGQLWITKDQVTNA